MPRNLLFGVVAAALVGCAIPLLDAAPANAQASCMHCSFQAAKCKRVGAMGPAKCEEQRLSCVKKCKAEAASAGGGDKAKSAEKAAKAKKQ